MNVEEPLKRPGPVGNFLDVLYVGQCEPLKAAVHGLLLVTMGVCALYNGAAWLKRRERHLGINAVLYGAATVWEHWHVQQHLACRPHPATARPDENPLKRDEDPLMPDADPLRDVA